ncbi:MAG: nucleotidyltransferase domain-containing protein [Bacteroidales bacterium]|nr:nucleotidyltransferase domain-containing protein [Bacteroidales bacterium]
MVDSNNILSYLRTNKDRLLRDYHLTKIGIFGSMSRGEQNDSSDIDLIIEFKPDTPDLYALKQKLKEEIQSRFNRQVDVCRLKYIKPIFKNQIQSETKYA